MTPREDRATASYSNEQKLLAHENSGGAKEEKRLAKLNTFTIKRKRQKFAEDGD